MDILSYILGKKNSGSNTGGSGGSSGSGSSNASVVVKGGTVVDPTQNYSRLYFNTALSNEEVKALMNNIELNWAGMMAILYFTNQSDQIGVMISADDDVYILASGSVGILFAINGNLLDESITFTGWNPDIDFSNGIGIIGNTIGTEIHTDDGSLVQIGVNNDKIVELFSSEPIKKSVNKVLSGVYDGNNIEVESAHIDISSLLDENKLPLNIDFVIENKLVDRTLTTYTNNSVTSVGGYAFYRHKNLTTANFSNVTNIGERAFESCARLTSINFPKVTDIGDVAFYDCPLTNADFPEASYIRSSAFRRCDKLTSIKFPKVTNIGEYAFNECANLTNAYFPEATAIRQYAFAKCYSLNKVFIAQAKQICTLDQSVFSNCYHILGTVDATHNPNGLKDGYIYVPASLLSQYKVATNWSAVASQIIGHEDLEAGATLPNYTTDTFTTQTWYSDERLTTVVTEVTAAGKYYCRLEA